MGEEPPPDPRRPTPSTPSTLDALRESVARGSTPAEHLLPLVYDELRALARQKLKQERPGQTLQPTALVHEAYLRVVGAQDPGWQGCAHFFGAAASAMRRILVEQARRKASLKRGGGMHAQRPDEPGGPDAIPEPMVEPPSDRVLDIEDALRDLEAKEPRKGRIVELRFFAGLSAEETATALGVTVRTVEREWRVARAILMRALDRREA